MAKAFYSKFVFIGALGIAKDKSKFHNTFLNSPKDTWASARINFMVKESDHNGVFVELFEGYQVDGKGKIFSKDLDFNNIEVPWGVRESEETLKMVADFKKFKADLGESKVFLSGYEMIEHLNVVLPTITDRVVVTGSVKKEYYKGKYNDKYIIQTIRLAKEDEKSKLSVSMDIFYSKDSLDSSDFKDEKVIRLSGFVSQYIDKDVKTKFMPQQFILSAKKLDFENEKHVAKFDFLKKYITVKGKTYVHIPWQMSIFRGADEVEWDESMLTKAQKEAIAFGLSTADNFKPRSNALGDNIFEYRLIKPLLTGEFSEGVMDTEMKIEEFEEDVFKPVEKTEKFKEPKEEKKVEQKFDIDKIVEDDEDEDLFS
ncbi:MAG TPA: hypothetical protein VIK72_09525 [Clostridiaceae bacterium]